MNRSILEEAWHSSKDLDMLEYVLNEGGNMKFNIYMFKYAPA